MEKFNILSFILIIRIFPYKKIYCLKNNILYFYITFLMRIFDTLLRFRELASFRFRNRVKFTFMTRTSKSVRSTENLLLTMLLTRNIRLLIWLLIIILNIILLLLVTTAIFHMVRVLLLNILLLVIVIVINAERVLEYSGGFITLFILMAIS